MTDSGASQSRREELSDRLARVEQRIVGACEAAGRPRSEVSLVVVTKHFPRTDVAALLDLGVTDIGENRDQEASIKLADLVDDPRLTIHFVGQLQRNKAAHVAAYADVVHSVDRRRLISALDRGAAQADRRLGILVQVDLDPSGTPDDGTLPVPVARGGVRPEDVSELAAAVAAADRLDLLGVMAVAPLSEDPAAAFARLAAVATSLTDDYPEATWVSAGMSDDLEAAVAAGATHLRVGTAILGSRPSLG